MCACVKRENDRAGMNSDAMASPTLIYCKQLHHSVVECCEWNIEFKVLNLQVLFCLFLMKCDQFDSMRTIKKWRKNSKNNSNIQRSFLFFLMWMKRNNWRYQKYHLDYSDWIKVRRKQQIEVKLLSGLFFIKLRVEIILCDVSGDQCKSQK